MGLPDVDATVDAARLEERATMLTAIWELARLI
jgi:hypothetical protein